MLSLFLSFIREPEPPPFVPSASEVGNIDSLQNEYYLAFYKEHFFDNHNLSSISITRMPFYARAIATYFTRLLKPQEPEIIHGVDFLLKKVESNPEIYRFTARQIFNILRTAPYAEVEKVALYLGENYIVNRPEMWDPIFIQQFEEYATMTSLNMAGTQANDLRLQDVAGNTLSLYDVQAKYTILLFFNPQCGACAVATPEIHTLYQTYKDKGLQVVAVYLDRDKDTWLNYITEKNFLDWINLWDAEETSGMFEKYDLHAIPTIYLLDQNKQVIEKNLYYTALNSIIKQLFGEE
jgi:peroxiredoxin